MTQSAAAEPAPPQSIARRWIRLPAAAMRRIWQRPWFWAPVGPLLALDLWSKSAVFAFLRERYGEHLPVESSWRHPVWAEDAVVTFHLVAWRNTGTVWGLGRGLTEPLVVLRCAALLLILYFAARLPQRARGQQLVLGMILAGAVGNLYDNLSQPDRGVRDFLLFATESVAWLNPFPAFNVADSCICVGAALLAILLWRDGSRAAGAAAPGPGGAGGGQSVKKAQ